MIKTLFLIPFCALSLFCGAQGIKAEFDKSTDFSRYKTFAFGEGEIITPKDQRQLPDSVIHKWIRVAVRDELTKKGMRQVRDSADLLVSYVTGSERRMDLSKNGPFGLTPGSNPDPNFQRDYKLGSLIIDLNDPKSNKLIWRVNATITSGNPESEGAIEEVVMKGFKKFSIKPKKERQKK